MGIEKDIDELKEAGILGEDTALKIEEYYLAKKGQSVNRLFIVFGILGGLLVGLGLMLLIAHNWDRIPRLAKSIIGLIPLIGGQAVCAYILLKKQNSTAWIEAGTAFLFLAIGAAIALISQIYHIPGNLSSFLLAWMLLGLPLVYIMKSSVASAFYIIGISFYTSESAYWADSGVNPLVYWLLLAAILPYYVTLIRNKPEGNFTRLHHWLVPMAFLIILGSVADTQPEPLLIAYFCMLGIIFIAGKNLLPDIRKTSFNGYTIIGYLGTLMLLIWLSFESYWEQLARDGALSQYGFGQELIVSSVLALLAALFWIKMYRGKAVEEIPIISLAFLVFIMAFIIGHYSMAVLWLINLYVLLVGIQEIRWGSKNDNIRQINFGLIIITILISCRFLDSDLSFITRGLVFIGLGISFFYLNFRLLKNNVRHAKK